jgi:hypothetical protein
MRICRGATCSRGRRAVAGYRSERDGMDHDPGRSWHFAVGVADQPNDKWVGKRVDDHAKWRGRRPSWASFDRRVACRDRAVLGSAAPDPLRVIAILRTRGCCRRCKPRVFATRKDLLDALVDPHLGVM